VLRDAGADVYDQWISHEIPFDDPAIASALDKVGTILKNPEYVNGGYGDVRSIADHVVPGRRPADPRGRVLLHRQASFYGNQWPEGTEIAEDGDVFALLLPR
jgi:alpha-glucoside transport system substrate-binding protein